MIQKSIVLFLSILLCISLIACSQTSSTKSTESSEPNISSTYSSDESSGMSGISSEPPVSSPESNVMSSGQSVNPDHEEPHISQWEQKQVMISGLDPFTFKTEAARYMYHNDLQFSDILRGINQYIGQKVTFHGIVLDLKRDSITSTGLLQCGSPSYDENFIIAFSYDGYPDFIKGDSIYLYGVITGTSQYYTHDNNRDDGEQAHETFNVDAYFYDSSNSTDNYTMTSQEQQYYSGDYTVYDFYEKDFYPLHVGANSINGHPYQIISCSNSPDGVYMRVQFTEYLDQYQRKDATIDPFDTIWLQTNGNIYVKIATGQKDLSHYYQNSGWNKKYGKPAWAVRKEKEVGAQAD